MVANTVRKCGLKIVLTGGPSAGKTSIVEIFHRSNTERVVIVEEAASVLYRGGFPRSPKETHVQSRQYAIFAVQRALEEIRKDEADGKTLICDRGSLDGLAYWAGTEADFFLRVGSTMNEEIERYDWVLHLDSADVHSYQNSPMRPESLEEAQKINERVKRAWREHPRRLIIPTSKDFMKKVTLVMRCLEMIHGGRSVVDIRSALDI